MPASPPPAVQQPSYISLLQSGELQRRAETAVARLSCCTLCPRNCKVNRLKNELGFCRTGRHAQVASFNLHWGEEEPLVGEQGSGTIFFGMCNLHCVFCQNHDISQPPVSRHSLHKTTRNEDSGDTKDEGHTEENGMEEGDAETLAAVMLHLQRQGALNINLVTPSHVVPQILEALVVAAQHGLTLPIVYNSSGYDSQEALALLDGVVDIYMPDIKYADPQHAKQYSGAKDYPEVARKAVKEMHRQVGDLTLDEENGQGIATRGLLVRHLVMPNNIAGTAEWMRFLADEISKDTYVNIMGQYRPCHKAGEYSAINRAPSQKEMQAAYSAARNAGITRLDKRTDRLAAYLLNQLLQDS